MSCKYALLLVISAVLCMGQMCDVDSILGDLPGILPPVGLTTEIILVATVRDSRGNLVKGARVQFKARKYCYDDVECGLDNIQWQKIATGVSGTATWTITYKLRSLESFVRDYVDVTVYARPPLSWPPTDVSTTELVPFYPGDGGRPKKVTLIFQTYPDLED